MKFSLLCFLTPILYAIRRSVPAQIGELEQGKSIRIDFVESYHITVILTPIGDQVECQLRKFTYQPNQQEYELEKSQEKNYCKTSLVGSIYVLPKILYIRRLHGTNTAKHNPKNKLAVEKIVERHGLMNYQFKSFRATFTNP